MPYSPEHRKRTRQQIIKAARRVFNEHGFDAATIGQIMSEAGLSHGGFYHHFTSKEELFSEAVASFLDETFNASNDQNLKGGAFVEAAMAGYLSTAHVQDIDNQCPMIALPSDTARAGKTAREAYQQIFRAMVQRFAENLQDQGSDAHRKALTLSMLAIGGMVVARTIEDPALVDEIISAAQDAPRELGVGLGND